MDPRTVLVVGGTSGIALALAERFAASGDRVAVISRNDEKVAAAVGRLSAASQSAGYSADVRDAERLAEITADIADRWGLIDVVISAAAGNFVVPADRMSANAFKSIVDIDLLGTFNVFKASWPHLRRPGASLVSLTAAQSWLPTPGQAHVGAAKAGMDQLTRTLAVEWGPHGVRVNAVAPGPVAGTEGMARLAPNDTARTAWERAIPLGRFARTEDIADAVAWLVSPEASFVTGVILSVDGGLGLGGASSMAQAIAGGNV